MKRAIWTIVLFVVLGFVLGFSLLLVPPAMAQGMGGGGSGLGVVGMTEAIADGLYLRLNGATVPTADLGIGGFGLTNMDNIIGDGSGSITNFHNAYVMTNFYEGGVALVSKYLGIVAKAADSDKLDAIDSTGFYRITGDTLEGILDGLSLIHI